MSLRTLQALWTLERISSDRVHEAATALLVKGVDSPALVQLAGMMTGATYWDVSPVMDRALVEAGLKPMSREAALWRLAYDTSMAILDGTVTPRWGATTLWGLCNDLDMPESLRYFVYLAADYGEGPEDQQTEEAWFDARIRETADELLAAMPEDGESPPSNPSCL